MQNALFFYSASLIIVGICGFLFTGAAHVTALIPCLFGAAELGCWATARSEARRKTAMHLAAVIALLALFGTARGLFQLIPLIFGAQVERPAAVASQSIVCLLSLYYILCSYRSFREARRRQNV